MSALSALSRSPQGPNSFQDCSIAKNLDIKYQGMFLVLSTL